MQKDDAHDDTLLAQLEEMHRSLIDRANNLFDDDQGRQDLYLIRRYIDDKLMTELTERYIVSHRKQLDDMPTMSVEEQLAFMDRQLAIERFLDDWRRFVNCQQR